MQSEVIEFRKKIGTKKKNQSLVFEEIPKQNKKTINSHLTKTNHNDLTKTNNVEL